MSTVDDTLPYMQAWLDSRPIVTTATTEFNAAQTALVNARQAIQTRVQAGDNAQQMKPLVDTYATTRTTFIAKDAALQTAQSNTANARAAFEASVELLARGMTIPPYTPPPTVLSDAVPSNTGVGIDLVVKPPPEPPEPES